MQAIKKPGRLAPTRTDEKITHPQYNTERKKKQMVKINTLQIENVKRIKAVELEPQKNGLTIIGGKNNQGKTSVLDSIAWALGGDRYKPSNATRDGSVIPPHIKLTLSNGLVVERKGANSSLVVTDPDGKRSGQQLLNEFVSQFAIDLPRFMEASDKDKANTLLRIIGVGDQLTALEHTESELYNQRLMIGRIADQKAKYAREMVSYDNVPTELVSPLALIKRQQEILATNGENQRKRERAGQLLAEKQQLRAKLDELQEKYEAVCRDCEIAQSSAQDLQDESTTELEASIAGVEEINRKVRANLDKDRAEDDAKQYREQYETLTAQIESTRREKMELLDGAKMPLAGLSVDNGKLLYNGFAWDGMSGSDQLKVSTAIVRSLNPHCGFVLLDKLEQMDVDTLREFGEWLVAENLQAIATRVSTGGECSIIIEDGYAAETNDNKSEVPQKQWKEGAF